ncbi:hypothetical protein GCM10009760_18120 [Kitasatospora kazusensis]|uniref:FtsX extracellular domain-containing protein n=1 Tax=Kitasatospora kazusensis TaxID=407974 RepID=A0ABP5KUC2_9ACTN
MNAAPRGRSQQTEREELALLLPAAAAPELSPHRHFLLKEHLMDTVTEHSRSAAKRRTLVLRVALPIGLAAAVAGVALATGAGRSPAPAPAPVVAGGGPSTGSQSLGTVTNAAYTVQSGGDDLVKLTILDGYKPVDATQLQHDLDRAGVRSRVYAGEPGCHAPEPTMASYPPEILAKADQDQDGGRGRLSAFGWDMEQQAGKEGGREVLTIRPGAIPADLRLFIYLPLAKTDPAHSSRELQAGLMQSPAPDCMPAKTYDNPLASLYPTPAPTH